LKEAVKEMRLILEQAALNSRKSKQL
jgi:hypothetical protein